MMYPITIDKLINLTFKNVILIDLVMRTGWIWMSPLFILFEIKKAGDRCWSDYQLKWLSDYWGESVSLKLDNLSGKYVHCKWDGFELGVHTHPLYEK